MGGKRGKYIYQDPGLVPVTVVSGFTFVKLKMYVSYYFCLLLNTHNKVPGKCDYSCFTEGIMGFKEVIDSKLSNLSKDTHLVNNRTTIHFKSTNTEVRGEGCFRVLSIYTFFIARNFFP